MLNSSTNQAEQEGEKKKVIISFVSDCFTIVR
jgi:hypothetical protein